MRHSVLFAPVAALLLGSAPALHAAPLTLQVAGQLKAIATAPQVGRVSIRRSGDNPVPAGTQQRTNALQSLRAATDTSLVRSFLLPFEVRSRPMGSAVETRFRVELHTAPLRYQRDSDAFVGEVLVGLSPQGGASGPIELGEPLIVEFLADADITPKQVAFSRGAAGYERVTVSKSRPSGPVSVQAVLAGNQTTVLAAVEPALLILQPPRRVEGWGFAKHALTVEVLGANLSDSITVRGAASAGTLDPPEAKIYADGRAARMMFAVNPLGPFSVTVSANGYQPAIYESVAHVPLGSIAAVLLGAAVGFVADRWRARRKREWWHSLIRVLAGALVAAAAHIGLGLDFLNIAESLSSYVALFAYSAIGAMVPRGVSGAIDAFHKARGKIKSPEDAASTGS